MRLDPQWANVPRVARLIGTQIVADAAQNAARRAEFSGIPAAFALADVQEDGLLLLGFDAESGDREYRIYDIERNDVRPADTLPRISVLIEG